MVLAKVIVLCLLVTLAVAGGYGGYGGGGYGGDGGHDVYAYPKYQFEYGVKDDHTDDHKSQHEIRDGGLVKGEYERAEKGVYQRLNYIYDSHHL
ncbi:hypothetical protein Trydic_g14150 [Trypoxylus dichotomus]